MDLGSLAMKAITWPMRRSLKKSTWLKLALGVILLVFVAMFIKPLLIIAGVAGALYAVTRKRE